MVKCVQLVGRLRDRATALFGGKIRIVVATRSALVFYVGNYRIAFGNFNIELLSLHIEFLSKCPICSGVPVAR